MATAAAESPSEHSTPIASATDEKLLGQEAESPQKVTAATATQGQEGDAPQRSAEHVLGVTSNVADQDCHDARIHQGEEGVRDSIAESCISSGGCSQKDAPAGEVLPTSDT